HLRPVDLSLAALHQRGESVSHHRFWMHRRSSSQRHDGPRNLQTLGLRRIQGERNAPRHQETVSWFCDFSPNAKRFRAATVTERTSCRRRMTMQTSRLVQQETCRDFALSSKLEWLETNGT